MSQESAAFSEDLSCMSRDVFITTGKNRSTLREPIQNQLKVQNDLHPDAEKTYETHHILFLKPTICFPVLVQSNGNSAIFSLFFFFLAHGLYILPIGKRGLF